MLGDIFNQAKSCFIITSSKITCDNYTKTIKPFYEQSLIPQSTTPYQITPHSSNAFKSSSDLFLVVLFQFAMSR